MFKHRLQRFSVYNTPLHILKFNECGSIKDVKNS